MMLPSRLEKKYLKNIMSSNRTTKTIVTLGPATNTEEDLRKIKARGVDFVRINAFQSSASDLKHFIALLKKVGISFTIDTEGSQVRSGIIDGGPIQLKKGAVVWLTGLSGSGKTTLAQVAQKALEEKGKRVCVLDGDIVRATLHKNLGFGREGARKNNHLIAKLAKEKSSEYDIVFVAVVAPFRDDRKHTRQMLGEKYVEVFVDCPLEVCEDRDVKGLYKKARSGEIDNLVGISESIPYEKPLAPDIVIKTNEMSVEEGTVILLKKVLL